MRTIIMKDVIIWQNIGSSSYAWVRGNFDTDGQGRISREAFEADPNGMIETELNSPFKVLTSITEVIDCVSRNTAVKGKFQEEMLAAIEGKISAMKKAAI